MQEHTVIFEPKLSNSELEELARSTGMNLEVMKDGKIRMTTPSVNESSKANMEILGQLWSWWRTHRRGSVFDSNTLFTLPDGSKLGPDAAYITEERLREVPPEALQGFAPVCPNFVIELLSKSDSFRKTEEKMHDWIKNGVELGWLVNPYDHSVFAYTPTDRTIAATSRTTKINGAGPVAGFTLDIAEVWNLY